MGPNKAEGAAKVTPQPHRGTQIPISHLHVHPLVSSLRGRISPGTPSCHSSSRSLQPQGMAFLGSPPEPGWALELEAAGRARTGAPRAGGAKPLTQFSSSARTSPSVPAGDGHGLQRQEPGAALGTFLQPESRCASGAALGARHSYGDTHRAQSLGHTGREVLSCSRSIWGGCR